MWSTETIAIMLLCGTFVILVTQVFAYQVLNRKFARLRDEYNIVYYKMSQSFTNSYAILSYLRENHPKTWKHITPLLVREYIDSNGGAKNLTHSWISMDVNFLPLSIYYLIVMGHKQIPGGNPDGKRFEAQTSQE